MDSRSDEFQVLQLEKIHTDRNGTDMMTKVLPKEKPEGPKRRLEGGIGADQNSSARTLPMCQI